MNAPEGCIPRCSGIYGYHPLESNFLWVWQAKEKKNKKDSSKADKIIWLFITLRNEIKRLRTLWRYRLQEGLPYTPDPPACLGFSEHRPWQLKKLKLCYLNYLLKCNRHMKMCYFPTKTLRLKDKSYSFPMGTVMPPLCFLLIRGKRRSWANNSPYPRCSCLPRSLH